MYCVSSEQLHGVLCVIRPTIGCVLCHQTNYTVYCVSSEKLHSVLCVIRPTTWYVLCHQTNYTVCCLSSDQLHGVFCVIRLATLFVCLVGFLTSSSTTRLYRGRVPRQERLTILRPATHATELGDHDFCLSRSHYTDTDPTCSYTVCCVSSDQLHCVFCVIRPATRCVVCHQTKPTACCVLSGRHCLPVCERVLTSFPIGIRHASEDD